MEFLLAALVGVAIGVVVGVLGAGGGILAVPVLIYLLGQAPHNATASSLVIVLLSAITALISHARAHNVQWKAGFTFGIFAISGAFAGARIAPRISENLLVTLFAALLLLVSALMGYRGWKIRRQENSPRKFSVDYHPETEPDPALATPDTTPPHDVNLTSISAAGLLVGVLSGIFGVGGGFAVVPLLIFIFGFTIRQATGTSLLVMMLTAAAGLVGRIDTPVTIDWPIVLLFAAGSALGGLLGEPIGRRFRPSTLTYLFSGLLVVMASLMLVETYLL
ncbi:MAG: sulfite exporter TauE/SafE family protein [Trueperella sp.]|nr:sulfite exporter TauE/SafE family protein [Trueperella sp.]